MEYVWIWEDDQHTSTAAFQGVFKELPALDELYGGMDVTFSIDLDHDFEKFVTVRGDGLAFRCLLTRFHVLDT